jgi:hypothetical protein
MMPPGLQLPRPTLHACADPPYGCGELLPGSKFTLSGRNVCDDCWENRHNAEARRRQEAKAKNAIKLVIAATSGTKIDAPHVSELCAEAFKACGGAQEYGRIVKQMIDNGIRDEKPHIVLKAMQMLTELCKLSSQMRDTAPDVFRMEDDELKNEQIRLLTTLLAKNGMQVQRLTYEDDELDAESKPQDDPDGT